MYHKASVHTPIGVCSVRRWNLLDRSSRRLKGEHITLCKATGGSSEDDENEETSEEEDSSQEEKTTRRESSSSKNAPLSLDDFNPIKMGRKSRKAFDSRIGGPSRTVVEAESLDLPEVFESPQALSTTVLVVGATGRVGKVLVRKLLLRGYTVKALVRRRSGEEEEDVMESIPQSVEVIEGDVGDYKACRKAVEGVDKVLFCAAARSTLTADLNRVDADGDEADQEAWDIGHVGPAPEEMEGSGFYAETRRKALSRARDIADALINEKDHLVFEGAVYSRNGYAIVDAEIGDEVRNGIATSDGLVMRILGDGQPYTAMVETDDGRVFSYRFRSSLGYSTVRIPFTMFSPDVISAEDPASNILEPRDIVSLGIKFEPSKKTMDQLVVPGQSMYDNAANRFQLEIDWIKALPGGIETDFILVSCGGAQRAEWSFDETVRERVVTAKRKGEAISEAVDWDTPLCVQELWLKKLEDIKHLFLTKGIESRSQLHALMLQTFA
eukprot:jgi/Picre1/34181/NNA_001655.t1